MIYSLIVFCCGVATGAAYRDLITGEGSKIKKAFEAASKAYKGY